VTNGLSDSIAPPVPDPTILTTEQLLRTAQAERDYVDGRIDVLIERLAGMDRATELLSDTVNRVPTETQKEVAHLAGLVDERFDSIRTQFAERDTRSERESRDNKVAVDAAFAAQKEAAAEQNKSNTTAINKSEEATTESINKLGELFKTTIDAVKESVDELKQRVQAIESSKQGVAENTQQNYQTREPVTAARMLMLTSITGIFAVIGVVTAVVIALGG
jgi:uncharacterized phage infection (PIP) family protein YhgE